MDRRQQPNAQTWPDDRTIPSSLPPGAHFSEDDELDWQDQPTWPPQAIASGQTPHHAMPSPFPDARTQGVWLGQPAGSHPEWPPKRPSAIHRLVDATHERRMSSAAGAVAAVVLLVAALVAAFTSGLVPFSSSSLTWYPGVQAGPKPTYTPQPTPRPTVTPVPTATPAPEPTATPAPSPTPAPTSTPAPSPTAAPSPTPVPTVEPTPSPPPDPSPTPSPQATVTPDSTVVPTTTPVSTATPVPHATPSPQPSASPEPDMPQTTAVA